MLPCCPEVPGFERVNNLGSGYVAYESDRAGYLDVSYVTHNDFPPTNAPHEWLADKTHTFQFLTQKNVMRRCRTLVDLDRFLREDRLSLTPFRHETDLVSVSHRRNCFLCCKQFLPLSRKLNCVKCGEVCAAIGVCTLDMHRYFVRNAVLSGTFASTKCGPKYARASNAPLAPLFLGRRLQVDHQNAF